MMGLHSVFWVTLVVAALGWLWQYLRLRQPTIPSPIYQQLFRENVWIGFGLLLGMILTRNF
jgi:4-hydroxybenzoate polyprenyltransferase